MLRILTPLSQTVRMVLINFRVLLRFLVWNRVVLGFGVKLRPSVIFCHLLNVQLLVCSNLLLPCWESDCIILKGILDYTVTQVRDVCLELQILLCLRACEFFSGIGATCHHGLHRLMNFFWEFDTSLANRMALIKFLCSAPVLGFGENCVRLCFSGIFRLCSVGSNWPTAPSSGIGVYMIILKCSRLYRLCFLVLVWCGVPYSRWLIEISQCPSFNIYL